jgi:hypothetical protein
MADRVKSRHGNRDGMEDGTRRVVGSVAANAAAISFPIIYLITVIAGCSWSTAFVRALGGALVIRALGSLLAVPLVAMLMQLLAARAAADKKEKAT